MIIKDLNYLEITTEEVLGGFSTTEYVDKDVTIDYTENVDIDKNLNSTVYIDGNFAFAEAAASAYGNDTVAQAITFTYSDDNSSTASATSVSGTN